jgi:fructose-1,6-bisphosphatase
MPHLSDREIRQLLPAMYLPDDMTDQELDIEISNWQQLNSYMSAHLYRLIEERARRHREG